MRIRSQIALAAAALATVGLSAKPEAKLTLALERVGDLSPRKIEINAEIAGLALGFLIKWSQSLPQSCR